MKKLILSLALLSSFPAFAVGTATGVVGGILPVQNGYVYIYPTAGTMATPPSCSIYGRFVLDTNTVGGRAQYAAISLAFALGKTITLRGTGACNIVSDSETIEYPNVTQ